MARKQINMHNACSYECTCTRNANPWLAFAHLVVHLLRAVEHVHHDAEGPSQIFGRLSLPCACRPSWCSAHGQVEGLSQSDVTSKFRGEP